MPIDAMREYAESGVQRLDQRMAQIATLVKMMA